MPMKRSRDTRQNAGVSDVSIAHPANLLNRLPSERLVAWTPQSSLLVFHVHVFGVDHAIILLLLGAAARTP
jgi:hypothetical protein